MGDYLSCVQLKEDWVETYGGVKLMDLLMEDGHWNKRVFRIKKDEKGCGLGNKVVKALYGLHQAPRAWYETLANYLLGNRFKRGKIDQTLFIKKKKGDILLAQVYVDDIIFGSTNKRVMHVKRGRDTKIPQSSPPVKVDDEAVHKELGDRMERAATTASNLEAEQDSDFLNSSHIKYALIENPKIYISLIQQFWGTAVARITDDGKVEITASIRWAIHDFTKLIFFLRGDLAFYRYVSDSARLTFQKGHFSPQWRPTISLVQPEQDMEYNFDVSTAEGFTTASVPVTTVGIEISTANISVSTAKCQGCCWTTQTSTKRKRFRTTEPTKDKARELWVELKRLFEPDDNDTLWKLQRYMHDPLKWWLYDACGVHHVSTKKHDIYMLVEKDYPLTKALATLMLCNKLRVDQYSDMADELLQKINIIANRPRQ
ncbi:ribonuclease H-like domain-containing protein [Tanacetum coccineum]